MLRVSSFPSCGIRFQLEPTVSEPHPAVKIRRAFELGSDDNLTAVVVAWSAEEKAGIPPGPMPCIAAWPLGRPMQKRNPGLTSFPE